MEDQGLSQRQLFTLKRRTLEKRIKNYYRETSDGTGAIEMLIVLQVREELCEADFSLMLSELVQYIFLKTRSTSAMRRYYTFFTEYFTKKVWNQLLIKLFPAKTFIIKKLEQLFTQFIKEPLAGLVGS